MLDLQNQVIDCIKKFISIETHHEFIQLLNERYFFLVRGTVVNEYIFKAPNEADVMKDGYTIFKEYIENKDWSALDLECKKYWSLKE